MDCDQDADLRPVRVLPDACVELFLSYTSPPVALIEDRLYVNSIVTSRMSRAVDVRMRKGAGCLAVCFLPGMAHYFFKPKMQELSDVVVPLSHLWPGMVAELEDRLAMAATNQARVAMLQQYLLQKLVIEKEDRQVTYCLNQIALCDGSITVQALTAATGLSQRHLSRRFQQCVGLSPQAYIRVSRFIRSLAHLKKYPAVSLTEIGYDSGYYDQSHFNREYKVFTGYTPGEVASAPHILC